MPLAGTQAGPGERCIAFGRTVYESKRAGKAQLQMGGGSPLYVYCNGILIWKQTAAHGYHPNADRIEVALEKGKNEFVVCNGYVAYLSIVTP